MVHIRTDHFYIQTARDQSVPYYPSVQGECAYDFKQNQWYTMTVEIVGDEIVAHVDREHFVVGQHPILDRQRTYFAFQVDRPSASLDNVQILQAAVLKEWPARRQQLKEIQSVRKPIARSARDRYERLLMNTWDLRYRADEAFRKLVAKVDAQKVKEHEQFPEVFSTIKQVRKQVDEQRRKLQSTDKRYQQQQKEINQARQAEREYVLAQDQGLKSLSPNQYAAAFERVRRKHEQDPQYLKLVQQRKTREQQQREMFPALFVTNEQIQAAQRAARKKLANQSEFKQLIKETAEAVQAEREYLFNSNPILRELHKEVFGN